jgi:multidrug efflux pump
MVTATFLAIFFIPLFFVMVVQLFEGRKRPGAVSPAEER